MLKRKKKNHLLIVGGTGFIGYHLAKYSINKNWSVSSISLKKSKNYRYLNKVKYIYIDITKFKEINKKLKGSFSHVVNLCGYNNYSDSKKIKEKIFNINFVGLTNLVRFFVSKNIKKFVQIGSSAEYGDIKSPQKENKNCLPNSTYGISKLKSTNYLLEIFGSIRFPVTVLRLFQVYGPKQGKKNFIPQIIHGCLNNTKFAVSKGKQLRDFCYVEDVVSAIFLTLNNKKVDGEILNVGSGKVITLKNVVNLVKQIIGKGKPQFGKIKYRTNENMKVFSNINKIKKKLKWKSKTKLINGINKTIQSYKHSA